MVKFTTKIINKGRITIPCEIRELLGVSDGDFVDLDIKKSEVK